MQNDSMAWCDIIAIFFGLLMLFFAWILGALGTPTLWAENWWPLLRVELLVWGFLRVVDLMTGGPWRRKEIYRP